MFGGVYFCFLSHKRYYSMSNEILPTDRVSAAVWNSINPISCMYYASVRANSSTLIYYYTIVSYAKEGKKANCVSKTWR